MSLELLKCTGCGAKLPPPSSPGGALVCEYCGAVSVAPPGMVWVPRPVDEKPLDPDRPRVSVAGTRYALVGRLGRGDSSDVFLARRDSRLTELVVLKVARALKDGDLVTREFEILEELNASKAQGAEHFSRLLPQPVARGLVKDPEGVERAAAVYRWRSGFQHTFADVLEAHAGGVEPRAAVWMWKRVLELLTFVHRGGYVHGAVLPPHLLVHPRDHGVVLVGWSCAQRLTPARRLPATSTAWQAFYPEATWNGAPATAEVDLAMSARCIAWLLGGSPASGEVPGGVPEPLAELVRITCQPESPRATGDAWQLKDRLDAAARAAFGPPRYVPFSMPGWRKPS